MVRYIWLMIINFFNFVLYDGLFKIIPFVASLRVIK